MNRLAPCPFCGSTTALAFDWDWGGIVCHACGAFGPNPSKDVANDKSLTEEQHMEHGAELWNNRPPVPEPIPCEFPGCGKPADYEGWYRRRDPFLGTPTGHIVRIAFCESCKSHPWLCANEPPKPPKEPP